MELSYAQYSDVGGRANNEDWYMSTPLKNGFLFVVADGLGGHASGEVASRLSVEAVRKYFQDSKDEYPDVSEAIQYANDIVLKNQFGDNSQMKTTIVVAFVIDDIAYIAHVGDSRLYAFKDGKIVYQTKDHSASQMAVMVGEITASEIRKHPDRNRLTRALGVSENIKVDVEVINNNDYDSLLLCTDGFWEYVLEDEMEKEYDKLVNDHNFKATFWLEKMSLIRSSRAPKKCDNNTAIVVVKGD